jgi:hypothetical protein
MGEYFGHKKVSRQIKKYYAFAARYFFAVLLMRVIINCRLSAFRTAYPLFN